MGGLLMLEGKVNASVVEALGLEYFAEFVNEVDSSSELHWFRYLSGQFEASQGMAQFGLQLVETTATSLQPGLKKRYLMVQSLSRVDKTVT